MELNPPPTIQGGLVLITQSLLRSDMSRAALVTCAVTTVGPLNLATLQDVVDDWQANWNSNITPAIDSNVTLAPPFAVMGTGTTVTVQAVASGAAVVGGNAGTYAPPNCALLVKKNTGVGGKANRGRMYIPFILPTTAVAENGTLDPGTVTAVNVRLANFLAQLVTDSTPMVISNKVFNVPLPPHYVTQINAGPAVGSFVAEGVVATQRRRVRS